MSDDSKPGENEGKSHPLDLEQNNDKEDKAGASDVAGPLLTDIEANQDDRKNVKGGVEKNDDDDDDYKQALEHRNQLLDDEAARQRIREELETYVGSLSSRTDENGEHLVEFPRNYQQIVSLMTQKDVSEEEANDQDGKQTRQSWSRVLIESGLSKQQAFGILEDVDDDSEGSSSLAAKIALKMARIRQLDTILEEKLGKNLYSAIVPRKQKRAQSPPQPKVIQGNGNNSSGRTFMTQTQHITSGAAVSNGCETSRSRASSRQSSAPNDELAPEVKKCNNFIERNKQVVANGMKANMTKDEEDRLEKLLHDESIPADDGSHGLASEENATPEIGATPRESNEFTMSDDEKKAIEKLIAAKSGACPLFAIDELQDGPTDEALPSTVKDNIIQETKRERLQRQRLSRVEQELRFLQESPSVVIVGDDRDEDENDDCRSEVSYATVASSTCSTRSGVISRHDFKCFLAQQKESFRSTPTASPDEIRRLLLSMGHGASASSNAVTATTSC
ncbi:hypothetical protein PHYPSEUDO_013675 [Phytophthora pseudosyringae]|uniref:Fibrous sheath-interacting protein 1 n=1 Tax=Phytophthora pseudosyringae TaxID=221518 RepID=A0A8T1W3H0_9STRA|nr:hypothetical protein PHYPSEUDO_013675 [Phytophthora pseudosyringae]